MAQGLNVVPWENSQSCVNMNQEKTEKAKKTRVTGSRRIFSPLFKIQVLDSYRQDLDCRGNQRATARKYNIHRRQIQKWLQSEEHLRSCVSDEVKSAVQNPSFKTCEASQIRVSTSPKKTEIISGKKDENETVTALNHSANIECRLPDAASRTRGEDRTRQTQLENPQTKVFNDKPVSQCNTSSRLEAHTLKRVAQKLYPRSPSTQREQVEKILTPTSTLYGPKSLNGSPAFPALEIKISDIYEPADNGKIEEHYTHINPDNPYKTANELFLDKNCNELYPNSNVSFKSDSRPLVPLNLENKIESTVPKDDITKEIFSDVFDKNSLNFEQSLLKESYVQDKLMTLNNKDKIKKNFGVGLALSQNIDGQEFLNERQPQCLLPKTSGQEFCNVSNSECREEIFKEQIQRAPTESCSLAEQVPISNSFIVQKYFNEMPSFALNSKYNFNSPRFLNGVSSDVADFSNSRLSSSTIQDEDCTSFYSSSVFNETNTNQTNISDENKEISNINNDVGSLSDKSKVEISEIRTASGENTTIVKSVISPKRKWIQESLQENEDLKPSKIVKHDQKSNESDSKPITVLPIKQRVKLDLRTKKEPNEPKYIPKEMKSEKRLSPNFSIERLCTSPSKDVKSDVSFTPNSYKSHYSGSPNSEYINSYFQYSNILPLAYGPPPFGPPLILQHRSIPDLVSLHFKPETNVSEAQHYPTYYQQYHHYSQGVTDTKNNCLMDIKLKEEKLSDNEENIDIDITSTTPIENKSFEFGNVTSGKRRSFSVQFKLSVLDAFYNDKDCNRNQRATARKYNINRRQVQKWLSQENELRNEGSVKNGKYLQRQRLVHESKDSSSDSLEYDKSSQGCRQCPQHCIKSRKMEQEIHSEIFPPLKSVPLCQSRDQDEAECNMKQTNNAICISTNTICQINNRNKEEYLYNLEKQKLFQSCDLLDNYQCQIFHDNVSLQFCPYTSVCDWSNVHPLTSNVMSQYPCLLPACQAHVGQVS